MLVPKIDGCLFHTAHCVILNSFRMGLKKLFSEDPVLQEMIKCFIALAFAPVEDFDTYWNALIAYCDERPILKASGFIAYFEVRLQFKPSSFY